MKQMNRPPTPQLWDEDGVELDITTSPIDVAAIAAAGRNRTPAPERRSEAWEDIVGTYGQPPSEIEPEKTESATPLDIKARVSAIRDQLK